MKIYNTKSYIKITAKARNELNLKGNQLLIYSIIETVALTNEYLLFSGTLKYLMNWSGLTKQTVINILNDFVEKKILFRHIDKDYKNRHKSYYTLNNEYYKNDG